VDHHLEELEEVEEVLLQVAVVVAVAEPNQT
jgi:hypothetical protein